MRSRPRSSERRAAPVTLAAGAASAGSQPEDQRGFTLVELMLTAAIVATILSMSVPMTTTALDEIRTSMAARYLEGRIMNARMLAVKRSASVALRFEAVGRGFAFAEYLDGNGNGVRSAEIAAGIDPQLAPRQFLHEQFPAVVFGLRANVPDIDGRGSRPTATGSASARAASSRSGPTERPHPGRCIYTAGAVSSRCACSARRAGLVCCDSIRGAGDG